jgi:hypothetical protein
VLPPISRGGKRETQLRCSTGSNFSTPLTRNQFFLAQFNSVKKTRWFNKKKTATQTVDTLSQAPFFKGLTVVENFAILRQLDFFVNGMARPPDSAFNRIGTAYISTKCMKTKVVEEKG